MICTPVENNGRHGYGKGRHAPKEFKCDLSAVTMPWRSVVFNRSANHCKGSPTPETHIAPNHTPTIADTVVEHAYSTWLAQLLWPLVSTRQAGGYLDLEGGNRICMPEVKRLAYSRIDLSLCCSVSLHLKGTWETQNHQTFCVSLVLVSFTLIYRAACPFLVKHSTIITSEESLRDSKLPVTGCLRTKGQESVYETCACVIHTILLY